MAVDHIANGILKDDTLMSSGVPNSRFRAESVDNLTDILIESRNCDPFSLVRSHLSTLNKSITEIIASDLPILRIAATHLFQARGKQMRPAVALLISRALSSDSYTILDAQHRLVEITEMIHTASLLHDDVVDKADVRRGIPSVNQKFGNKTAILGGDYLLARASLALARLKNVEVFELMAIVIEHLVKGEILQTRNSMQRLSPLDLYTTKTFYKTASLIANSCTAVAVLGNHDILHQEIVFEYGKHLGIVFQIIDDVLDFSGSLMSLGKPALHDLKNGIASAPILFAAEEFPELIELTERRFSEPGDVEKALLVLKQSKGIEKARELAQKHADLAVCAILQLKPSEARMGLVRLVSMALERTT